MIAALGYETDETEVKRPPKRVLQEKIDGGDFGLDVAKGVAQAFLYDNAAEFYDLPRLDRPPGAGAKPPSRAS